MFAISQLGKPIFTKSANTKAGSLGCVLELYGRLDLQDAATKRALVARAEELGAEESHVCFMRPASTRNDRGHKMVTAAAFGKCGPVATDAVYLTQPNTALCMPTADCRQLFLRNTRTGRVGLAHCGRAALEPAVTDTDKKPIVFSLVEKVHEGCPSEEIEAFMYASISADKFLHEDQSAGDHLAAYTKVFGKYAFADASRRTLDLHAIAERYLKGCGITNIEQDRRCTKTEPAFASHRAGDKTRNVSLLVLRK